jgi:hypothetical protein
VRTEPLRGQTQLLPLVVSGKAIPIHAVGDTIPSTIVLNLCTKITEEGAFGDLLPIYLQRYDLRISVHSHDLAFRGFESKAILDTEVLRNFEH